MDSRNMQDRELIRHLAIEHCDGEGDYILVCQPAGDDDDE